MRGFWWFLVIVFVIGAAFFVVIGAAFFVDTNYGAYSEIYECSGVTVTDKPAPGKPITLFIRITQFRWWRLMPHDGVLRLEIPVGTTRSHRADVFAINRTGPAYLNLHRWPKGVDYHDLTKEVDLTKQGQGQFSTISNSLILMISDDEQFQGSCKP